MKPICILALGDIVGEQAIEMLENNLKEIKEKYSVDFVIANGENACKARGITKKLFYRLIDSGIDVVTMGNHTYSNPDIYEIDDKRLIIPLNGHRKTKEKGYEIFECKGSQIFVANLLGKSLGGELNAFKEIREVLHHLKEDIKIKVIDFHAECCNEKMALAYMLRNDVSMVYGTHTHVQTNDAKILYHRLGYITDIGMCGPIRSAIGYDLDFEVKRWLEDNGQDSILSDDSNCQINGIIFKVDPNTGNTLNVHTIVI